MTEALAKQAVKDFSPSNAQKKKARENALDKNVNISKGSIIIKLQLCGKYCGTCPHGPYAWHVLDGDWTYLGAVGGGIGTGSVGKALVTNEAAEEEKDKRTGGANISVNRQQELLKQFKDVKEGDSIQVETDSGVMELTYTNRQYVDEEGQQWFWDNEMLVPAREGPFDSPDEEARTHVLGIEPLA